MSEIRFIRRGGRVIPIRAKSGAPADAKRSYPAVKRPSNGAIAVGAAVGIAAAKMVQGGKLAYGIGAALGALTVASSRVTKKRKGESDSSAAKRVSNVYNSKKYRGTTG